MTVQAVLDDLRKRPGTGDVITVIDPATEETITEFTDCGQEAVNEAAARAKASFESGVWSELPGRERAKILWRIGDLIDEHAEEFAQLDSLNTGMPLMQAQLQMSTCSEFFRYYAGWCSKINGVAYDVKTDGIATDNYVNMHAYTLKEPYSVVGLIFRGTGRSSTRARNSRRPWPRAAACSSSPPRRRRCRHCCWTSSSTRPAFPRASSTC